MHVSLHCMYYQISSYFCFDLIFTFRSQKIQYPEIRFSIVCYQETLFITKGDRNKFKWLNNPPPFLKLCAQKKKEKDSNTCTCTVSDACLRDYSFIKELIQHYSTSNIQHYSTSKYFKNHFKHDKPKKTTTLEI